MHNHQQKAKWTNVLLTDSGLFYDNELDKPLDILINSFKAMLQKPFSHATVLFIPTAAMQSEAKAVAITNRLRNELLTLGIPPANITIHDIDGSITEEDAMAHNVIYFTGGNTPYLAKRVRDTGFEKIILKMIFSNKVYIGMSAGSMLLMPSFNVDDIHNPTFTGLGLVRAYCSVHCNKDLPIRTDLPLPHIALQENQAIEVCWDGYKMLDGNSQYTK